MINRVWVLLAVFIFSTGVAQAEVYFAVQTGLKCVSCHTNPTGGGKRTDYGDIFAQGLWSARLPKTYWNGVITDQLSVGADARGNVDSVSIPNQENQFAFTFEEALLYVQFDLIEDKLTFYVDEQVGPGGASNREAYALYWLDNKKYYVKAGKMFLPFGFRLEDDTAFIRSVTGINYNTPDNGVEVGMETETLSLNLAITNGTSGAGEIDRGKQFSLRGSYIRPKWRVGASLNFNDADIGERTMAGVFGGLRTGKVSWLGEVGFIRDDSTPTGRRESVVALAEGNILLKKGHNLKLTYEYFDPDDNVNEDDRNRASIVYEYFPMQFTQVSIGYRASDGIPQNDLQNTDEAFLQLHVYF